MTRESIHVVSRSDGGWVVRKAGESRASGKFAKKSDAVSCARMKAMASGCEVIIHNRDGRIAEKTTYDRAAYPPRAKR